MNAKPVLIGIGVLLGLILISGMTYRVNEWEQIIVTQFGNPVGEPVRDAGLHFKLPFVQTVNRFDKRILIWDGKRNSINTADKRFIWVDTTARWRIADPLLFLQRVRSEIGAQQKLDGVLDSATRNVVSSYNLIEAVRLSNRVLDIPMEASEGDLDQRERVRITAGRNVLVEEIMLQAQELMPSYGMELIDLRFKRINYVDEVRLSVYNRMRSERERIAERFRSEGLGTKKEILGETEKDEKEILSTAYREAQEFIAQADADAARIFADAYNADPEFYSFWRSLEAYKKILGRNHTLVLSPDSELYAYLTGSIGISE